MPSRKRRFCLGRRTHTANQKRAKKQQETVEEQELRRKKCRLYMAQSRLYPTIRRAVWSTQKPCRTEESEKDEMNEPSPEVKGRKRTFSDRQRVLEEKKIQQQREEAERVRIEEEKRLKRDAKRREKRDRERREAMRVQRIDEQTRNEISGYYGQNYSVHPALTHKSPSKPSTVIMPEYDAFSEGMTPECIIGATDELGELCFFVKWKGTDDADFVPAKKAKVHCPQLVIRYYENIISWN